MRATKWTVVLGFVLALGAETALAEDPVKGEVLVVLAKEEAGTVDPALRNEPALRRAPFNSFRTMQIISRKEIRLVKGRATIFKLPNKRQLKVELQQKLPDGRFRVSISINKPGKEDYLRQLTVVMSPGEPFFSGGQRHEGGTLVIGVRVGERPSS